MSEVVAKAESIESGGNISEEDEMKPEAVKNEGPLLPDNDLKQKRGKIKAAHTNIWKACPILHINNVKHVKNGRHNSTPTTWKSSTSPLGTSASDVTISTTLSQKRSTRSAPTDLPRQTSQLDLYIQKQMLELEVKLEQIKIQMEANATSVTETLSKALKRMGEQLGTLIDSSKCEILANTQLVKDSRKTLHDMNQKIETVKLDFNAQIDGLRTEIGVRKVHLRTIQEQVIDQGARKPNRPQTLSARQEVSVRSTLKSLEATVLHRKTLLDADTSS
ncbi:hypothetical protein OUZ56_003566 [Daphnia magna]|uniref:Uncharacterized protein n=1 Tax=Daphnia magna TaxID=35525 RepID=A0ABR0A934_9CRUS|nr:hypothetical protein OUZ56_003566 [Daphnia magna]